MCRGMIVLSRTWSVAELTDRPSPTPEPPESLSLLSLPGEPAGPLGVPGTEEGVLLRVGVPTRRESTRSFTSCRAAGGVAGYNPHAQYP